MSLSVPELSGPSRELCPMLTVGTVMATSTQRPLLDLQAPFRSFPVTFGRKGEGWREKVAGHLHLHLHLRAEEKAMKVESTPS